MIIRNKKRPGFMLLDLLLAMVLLTVILSVVYFVFANQERAARAASEYSDIYGQGRVILDLLSRDIAGAWLPKTERLESKISYAFRGREDGCDFISTGLIAPGTSSALSLAEIGYRVVENERKAGYTLVRRQDQSLDAEMDAGGTDIVLTRDLAGIKLGYVDSSGLTQTDWEAAVFSKLPKAVKIEITLTLEADGNSSQKREKTFSTMVGLTLAWPKMKRIDLPAGVELPL